MPLNKEIKPNQTSISIAVVNKTDQCHYGKKILIGIKVLIGIKKSS